MSPKFTPLELALLQHLKNECPPLHYLAMYEEELPKTSFFQEVSETTLCTLDEFRETINRLYVEGLIDVVRQAVPSFPVVISVAITQNGLAVLRNR